MTTAGHPSESPSPVVSLRLLQRSPTASAGPDGVVDRLAQTLGAVLAEYQDLAAAFEDDGRAGELVPPLAQALGAAIAAYMDLAGDSGYGYSSLLVDSWLDTLAGAGVDLVDCLGPDPGFSPVSALLPPDR
jgi:hypothetical protein